MLQAKAVLQLQACQQVGKIPADDQTKILEHCHASGGKIWIDADNFAKHRITNIPMKFAYLLGDAKGPKSV